MLHLSDLIETVIPAGRWQALNEPLGVTAFGLNSVSLEPGEQPDIEHNEVDCGHQEAYIVVSGKAGFRVADELFLASPGDVVAVPDPSETRSYWAIEPGTRIVCVGAPFDVDHEYGAWIAENAASAAS